MLDASLTGTLPAAGLAGQSLLATGSLNFGNAPIPLGSLSGFVYVDNNNSGQKLPGDAPIAGVTLTLVRTDTASPVTIGTTTTAADGSYSFAGLTPGTYKVVETQPSAYLDGLDSRNGAIIAGSATGVDTVAGIVVTAGNNSPSNNFGELAPASVAGTVYFDKDASGTLTAGDVGLSGVTVTLTGTNDLGAITPIVATTGPGGTYSFGNLRPGTYAVAEAQPAGYAQGTDTVGAVGTVSTGTLSATDVFSGVALAPGTAGVAYNFGELGTGISGTVFYDANKSTTLDAGDSGLGGLTVTLKNAAGAVVATTITAANGTYSFPNVAPGTYTVVESVKPGYGTDTPVTLPVTVATTPITGINFGQTLGSLAGNVYFDNDASGTLSTNDLPLGGVTVNLLNSAGTVIQTTTTLANGTYLFTGLTAGSYGVSEVQPALYSQGTDTPGSVGGSVTAVDVIAGANLPAGVAAVSYNFGEVPPSTLSGYVYIDANDNGVKDAGDAGIAGVAVRLAGIDDLGNPVSAVTTTDAGGAYSFGILRPGTYVVTETQPAGYLDGLDSRNGAVLGGSRTTDVIGGIVVGPGGDAPANNFGELVASTLGGNVYLDKNSDGSLDNAEVGIAGVTLKLTGTNDLGTAVSLTTITGPAGAYSFGDLRPGTYVVTETQPAGYTTTGNSVGTVNGVTDGISNIVIPGGVAGINYNFGEIRLVQTTTPKPLVSGDTATIGYWAHSGQALILSLNGGSTSTQLATWLSSNFPGLFPTSLIGTTNQGVANYMKAVFRGQSPKAEAQVLAVALAAYATDSDLAGTTATAYGFNVSASGTAAKTYNVGSNGPSLGLAANGLYSILDLLYAANTVAVDGGLYVNDNGLRSRVTSVFDGINIAGDRI